MNMSRAVKIEYRDRRNIGVRLSPAPIQRNANRRRESRSRAVPLLAPSPVKKTEMASMAEISWARPANPSHGRSDRDASILKFQVKSIIPTMDDVTTTSTIRIHFAHGHRWSSPERCGKYQPEKHHPHRPEPVYPRCHSMAALRNGQPQPNSCAVSPKLRRRASSSQASGS